MSKPLAHLVNLLITNRFPNEWKKAVVTPVFKGEEHGFICNCHPVSVLPVLFKILEKIVAAFIQSSLVLDQNVLQKLLTVTSLKILLAFWMMMMFSRQFFLTKKKASDTVSHDILLSKLKFDLSKQAADWFESHLYKREQCVGVNQEMYC